MLYIVLYVAAPVDQLHMRLTFSHLTCKIFHTQSFPCGQADRQGGRESERERPSALAQRVKCKYSKLFLKCAQRLPNSPPPPWGHYTLYTLLSAWVLFSFRCSANVIGIRSFVSFAHDVFCNNKIWLKFLIKFMRAHSGQPLFQPLRNFCPGQLYFGTFFFLLPAHCRWVCYRVD